MSTDLHYDLTDETVTIAGVVLYRIRATRALPDQGVRAGDLGGYVESLLVDGLPRIGRHAWVSGDAWVSDQAWVSGQARVSGDAWVSDHAWVSGDAWVSDQAWVSGQARVSGDAWVSDQARVSGQARVSDQARVHDQARVSQRGHVLYGAGLPSGRYTLTRQREGHLLRVGCWTGTTTDLRALIAGETWPEARGEQIAQRRPMLAALADMCDAVIATWTWDDIEVDR